MNEIQTQYIEYLKIYYAALAAGWMACALFSGWLAYGTLRELGAAKGPADPAQRRLFRWLAAVAVFCAAFALYDALAFAKVSVAPRVVILEKFPRQAQTGIDQWTERAR